MMKTFKEKASKIQKEIWNRYSDRWLEETEEIANKLDKPFLTTEEAPDVDIEAYDEELWAAIYDLAIIHYSEVNTLKEPITEVCRASFNTVWFKYHGYWYAVQTALKSYELLGLPAKTFMNRALPLSGLEAEYANAHSIKGRESEDQKQIAILKEEKNALRAEVSDKEEKIMDWKVASIIAWVGMTIEGILLMLS